MNQEKVVAKETPQPQQEWLQRMDNYGNDNPQVLNFIDSYPTTYSPPRVLVEILEINEDSTQAHVISYLAKTFFFF
jgi:hypothetical protein